MFNVSHARKIDMSKFDGNIVNARQMFLRAHIELDISGINLHEIRLKDYTFHNAEIRNLKFSLVEKEDISIFNGAFSITHGEGNWIKG